MTLQSFNFFFSFSILSIDFSLPASETLYLCKWRDAVMVSLLGVDNCGSNRAEPVALGGFFVFSLGLAGYSRTSGVLRVIRRGTSSQLRLRVRSKKTFNHCLLLRICPSITDAFWFPQVDKCLNLLLWNKLLALVALCNSKCICQVLKGLLVL